MTRGLLRSTSVVGGMTLVSRVLGFLRDMVFARIFGASAGMDVFVLAFQIPNFLRRLFAEGAFSQAFVPVFSEYHTKRTPDELQALADRVAGTLGLVLFGITLIGVAASPWLIYLFGSGFATEPGKFELAAALLRITFPYLLFISLTALAGGILNTLGRFGPPAFTPVLLNVCLIGAAIWVAPLFEDPIEGLAWGVFVAGVAQLAFQLPFLHRAGVLPRPRWGWRDSGVQRIFKLMLPAMFGSSVAQINLIVDRHIATYLVTGSISWLYYSDRLMEFPLGVFAIALATVILPGLSRHHAKGDRETFSATLDWALKLVAVLAVPAAVSLATLAGPMLATLFEHGAFSTADTRMASYSLMAYALGLLGFVLVKVLAPGYFARQDTTGPVRVGIVAMLVNIVLNVVIVLPWLAAGLPAAHAGLALATGLSAILNATLLYRGLRRQDVYRPGDGWPRLLIQVTIANAALGAALWYAAGPLELWSALMWHERALRLTGLVLGGAGLYAATLLLMGLRPRHVLLAAPSGAARSRDEGPR
ncbi:MAG: murein biosynthesis integral membrane protein MurJ [Pseudomonadota bacterium]